MTLVLGRDQSASPHPLYCTASPPYCLFFGCPAHIRDIHIHIYLPYYLYMMKGLMGDLLCQSQNLCVDGGDGTHRLEAS